MIDIETYVFNRLADTLRSSYPDIRLYGEDVFVMSKFPCVTIVEADNYAYDSTQDSGSLENHAVLMYEVNIYSNKANGRKEECKKIQKTADREFQKMGFTRISKVPMSVNNATIYRIVSRYSGVVSKNEGIYRR